MSLFENYFVYCRAKLGQGLMSGDYSKPPEAGDENVNVKFRYSEFMFQPLSCWILLCTTFPIFYPAFQL